MRSTSRMKQRLSSLLLGFSTTTKRQKETSSKEVQLERKCTATDRTVIQSTDHPISLTENQGKWTGKKQLEKTPLLQACASASVSARVAASAPNP